MPCGFEKDHAKEERALTIALLSDERVQWPGVVYRHDPLCECRHSALRYREPWMVPLTQEEAERALDAGFEVSRGNMLRCWERLSASPQRFSEKGSLLRARLYDLPKPRDLTAETMGVPEEDNWARRRSRKRAAGRPRARARKRRAQAALVMSVIADETLLVKERGRVEVWTIPGLKMRRAAPTPPSCRCGALKPILAGNGICGSCGHRCLC
jgi:hypothetical protein